MSGAIATVGGVTWPVAPQVDSAGHSGACADGPQCFWISDTSEAANTVWRDVQPFQAEYDKKAKGWHLGADYNLGSDEFDKDKPVYPAAAGTIARVAQNECGWGNIVFVRHDTSAGPYTTMYAHVAWIGGNAPAVGTVVDSSSPIALIGNGAWDNKDCKHQKKKGEWPYHLHFELRMGTNVDAGSGYSPERVTVGPEGQLDPNAFISINRSNRFFDDFSGAALDPAKWAVEAISTPPANMVMSGGYLNIDIAGGSCGSCGVAKGVRLRPLIGAMGGNFEVVVSGEELLRQARDASSPLSVLNLELTSGAARLGIYVVGDAENNSGSPGHKVISYYLDGTVNDQANDALAIGQYYAIDFRIKRQGGVTSIAYRLGPQAPWIDRTIASANQALPWEVKLSAFSGDGGGTQVNSRFVSRLDYVSVVWD
jgi:murein DD-endopeptidase MepM/ murein hydrolase activator NlpD